MAAAKKKEAAPKKEATKKSKDGVFTATELRSKKAEELKALVLDLKKEQFNLRFQKKSGELTNTSRIKQVRRNIATIKTVLNENSKESA